MVNIFLTGAPRSGKSTLLKNILLQFEGEKRGFITEEECCQGERYGFVAVRNDGQRTYLATIDQETEWSIPTSSNKRASCYYIRVPAFTRFLEPLFSINSGELLYIDEVGQMEFLSDRFGPLVEEYLGNPSHFIGTLSQVYENSLIQAIRQRDDVEIIEITPENRDQVQQQLLERLRANTH